MQSNCVGQIKHVCQLDIAHEAPICNNPNTQDCNRSWLLSISAFPFYLFSQCLSIPVSLVLVPSSLCCVFRKLYICHSLPIVYAPIRLYYVSAAPSEAFALKTQGFSRPKGIVVNICVALTAPIFLPPITAQILSGYLLLPHSAMSV